MSEAKNWRDNVELIVNILAGILIPVTIVIAGHLITRQQQKDNDATLKQQRESDLADRNADRAANLLQFLASENARERQLAVRMIEHLSRTNQFPTELGPALISVALTDPDAEVARLASESLPQIYQSNPELEKMAVTETQRILRNKGYYDGEINGNNDERTKAALRRFQQESGIESDGTVRTGTLQKLRDTQQQRTQPAQPDAQTPQRPRLRSQR